MKIQQYQMSQSEKTIDYRNAKYQGEVNQLNQRDGVGVLVDDDLSFYVSQWAQNQLSGKTIVYLSHAKYIYGQWKNNQPHGLNVFRIGDTVLLGVLENGQISGRVLVIFQRFNFIAILQKYEPLGKTDTNGNKKEDFKVIKSGELRSHEDLLDNIKLLNFKVPDCYFSLTKFICNMVNETIKARPMKSGNCYFGYDQGLAIVFNSNNGVVSVGVHSKGKVSEFGGKFSSKGESQQGNFQTSQTILYKGVRPKNQIYSIFQKIHKRSLYFENHYFYSKVKTLSKVQTLLRGKIAQIAESSRKQLRKFTVTDLNQSLDYHAIDQNQEDKINENRKTVYENPIYEMMKKVKSELSEQKTPKKQRSKTPIKKRSPSVNVVRKNIEERQKNVQERNKSPIYIPKLQTKKTTTTQKPQNLGQQRSLSKNKLQKKIKYFQNLKTEDTKHCKQQKSNGKNNQIQHNVDVSQNDNRQEQLHFTFKNSKDQNSYVDSLQQTKKLNIGSKAIIKPQKQQVVVQITHFKNNRTQKKEQSQQHKNIPREKQNEREGRQTYICYESPVTKRSPKHAQQIEERSKAKLSQSPYRLSTKYEDLNQRRSRLLKQFKNLNENSHKLESQDKNCEIAGKKRNTKSVYQVNEDSPYNQQKFLNTNSLNSKSQQLSNGCIPLSIALANRNENAFQKVDMNIKNEVSCYKKRNQLVVERQNTYQMRRNTNQMKFSQEYLERKQNILALKGKNNQQGRTLQIKSQYSPLSYFKQERLETIKSSNKHKQEVAQPEIGSSSKNSYTPSRRKQYHYQYCFQ